MQQKLKVLAIVMMSVSGAQSVLAQTDTPATDSVATRSLPSSIEKTFRNSDERLLAPLSLAAMRYTSTRTPNLNVPLRQEAKSHRGRNAAIGGILGAALGIGVCTGISNIMDDSAKSRVSTCTVGGNLIFGVAGAGVGALIGAAIK